MEDVINTDKDNIDLIDVNIKTTIKESTDPVSATVDDNSQVADKDSSIYPHVQSISDNDAIVIKESIELSKIKDHQKQIKVWLADVKRKIYEVETSYLEGDFLCLLILSTVEYNIQSIAVIS